MRARSTENESVAKLSPFIDEHGVLRMRGRIDACEWADKAAKNPILLPRNNHVTNLVMADYHAACRHQNHQTAINQIRGWDISHKDVSHKDVSHTDVWHNGHLA